MKLENLKIAIFSESQFFFDFDFSDYLYEEFGINSSQIVNIFNSVQFEHELKKYKCDLLIIDEENFLKYGDKIKKNKMKMISLSKEEDCIEKFVEDLNKFFEKLQKINK